MLLDFSPASLAEEWLAKVPVGNRLGAFAGIAALARRHNVVGLIKPASVQGKHMVSGDAGAFAAIGALPAKETVAHLNLLCGKWQQSTAVGRSLPAFTPPVQLSYPFAI
jgi:hypothetical protein